LIAGRRSACQSLRTLQLDQAKVSDLCDVTAGRVYELFRRFDTDRDGLISATELSACLSTRGIVLDDEQATRVMERMGQCRRPDEDSHLTMLDFEFVLEHMRMAELFTPSHGLFQWVVDRKSSECLLYCCDFGSGHCLQHRIVGNNALASGGASFLPRTAPTISPEEFYFQFHHAPRLSGAPTAVRWVHVDATRGGSIDRLTLLRLAVKYRMHPLAVGDILDSRTQTKIDRYADNYFVSAGVLQLSQESVAHGSKPGVPPRVRVQRSNISLWLGTPSTSSSLVSIHQDRPDESSWLALWKGESLPTAPADADALKCTWAGLFCDLREEPPRRLRSEAADFLLYEVLQCVVAELRPIADAYADRLGYMHQQSTRNSTTEFQQELGNVQVELLDLGRTIRPMRQTVRHIINDEDIGGTASTYLEDVEDAVVAMIEDVAQLSQMAKSLEEAYEKTQDKQMNSTLFLLSVFSAVFLPAQFITGLYGMNFVKEDGTPNIPELQWRFGYGYFWILQAFMLVGAVSLVLCVSSFSRSHVMPLLQHCRTGCYRHCCCCRREGYQSSRRVKVDTDTLVTGGSLEP